MEKDWLWVIAPVGLLAYAFGVFGGDKRTAALKKARAAKKRYARAGKRSIKSRPGKKRTKAELKAIRLKNLAKARRAKKAKR